MTFAEAEKLLAARGMVFARRLRMDQEYDDWLVLRQHGEPSHVACGATWHEAFAEATGLAPL